MTRSSRPSPRAHATKAIVYARLSMIGETEESLTRQVNDGIARAKSDGWTPVVLQEPKGLRSGFYESQRPAWREAKRLVASDPDIAAVIVADLARSYRKASSQLQFVDDCVSLGVQFISLKEDIDPHSAMGRAFIGMAAVFNQLYRDDISERKKNQYRARDKSIYASNVPPFGLKREGSYPNITWTTTPEFKYVVAVFDLYVTGLSCAEVARELRKRGITWSNRGASGPNAHILINLLRHAEQYRPFLEPQVFAQAVALRALRSNHRSNSALQKHPPMLLKQLCFCAVCGARFHSNYRTAPQRYSTYYHPADPVCRYSGQTAMAHRIESEFWQQWQLFELSDAEIEELAHPRDSRPAQDREANRAKLVDKLHGFEEMRAAKDITRERFLEVKADIESQLAKLELVPAVPRHHYSPDEIRRAWETFPAFADDPGLDPRVKNTRLRLLVRRVLVENRHVTRIEYVWNVPAPVDVK